jgi:hypothetical protein
MFGGADPKKIEFLWLDGKKHKIQIREDAELVDFKQLMDTYHKMAEEKEEQCKPIYYLGLGLTGNPYAAKGFLYGWLVKSIRDSLEKSGKAKWVIDHSFDEVSEDEARNHIATELEELAKQIRENDEFKVKKAPVLRGDVDGTELYG